MSIIEIIVWRSRSRSYLEITSLFLSGLYLKTIDQHLCSLLYRFFIYVRVSRIKLGDLVKGSRSFFFLFPNSQNLPIHLSQFATFSPSCYIAKRLRSYQASNIDLDPRYFYLIRSYTWLHIHVPDKRLILVGNPGFPC